MKKALSLFFIILIMINLLSIKIFAATTIDFEIQSADIKPNRIFSVDILAVGDKKLCAATFEISCNNSLLEFRKAKACLNNSKIQTNYDGKKLKIVFLNSNGQKISENPSIITLTFKSLDEGTSDINFYISECVDEDVNFADIGSCTASTVKIRRNATETISQSKSISSKISRKTSASSTKTNKSSKKSEKKYSRSKQSKSEQIEASSSTSKHTNLGELNPTSDNRLEFMFIGIGLGVGIIGIAIIIFILGKHYAENKAEKEKNKNDISLNQNTDK